MTQIDQKRGLIKKFLEQSILFAEKELERYRSLLLEKEGLDRLTIEEKVLRWSTYRAFQEYTMEELKTGKLDDWL